jgi:hypothetical protein
LTNVLTMSYIDMRVLLTLSQNVISINERVVFPFCLIHHGNKEFKTMWMIARPLSSTTTTLCASFRGKTSAGLQPVSSCRRKCSEASVLYRWRAMSSRPPAAQIGSSSHGSADRRFTSMTSASSTDTDWAKKLSKREMASLEDWLSRHVGTKLRDPVLDDQDLAALQWIHPRLAVSADDGTFQVLLKLPTLLHPKLDELKARVRRACEQEIQAWRMAQQPTTAASVNVRVEAMATKPIPIMARLVENHGELLESLGPGLCNVSHFVAVYSCKGGVGKSTVAVNLAYELAHMGGRIGLLDLDIYGPSLPILVRPENPAILPSPVGPGMVYPIVHGGVKLLSLGFVARQV